MTAKLNLDFPDASKRSTISDLLETIELVAGEALVPQIYGILWNLIVTVQLRPGQLVSEKEISESLQASKTPVREALIRLEETGLVQVVPKSGTYVTPIRINTYIEACFTRLQLEIGAVRRAAQRHHDVRRLALLDEILDQQVESLKNEEYELFFELDERLHETFFVMAGVAGVWDIVKRTQSEVYRVRHLKRAFNINKRPKVLIDHQAIVAAIRAGNPDDAQNALVCHIGSLESELEELSAQPELLEFIENLSAQKPRARSRHAS